MNHPGRTLVCPHYRTLSAIRPAIIDRGVSPLKKNRCIMHESTVYFRFRSISATFPVLALSPLRRRRVNEPRPVASDPNFHAGVKVRVQDRRRDRDRFVTVNDRELYAKLTMSVSRPFVYLRVFLSRRVEENFDSASFGITDILYRLSNFSDTWIHRKTSHTGNVVLGNYLSRRAIVSRISRRQRTIDSTLRSTTAAR